MPNLKTVLLGLSFVALLATGWALYQKGREHERAVQEVAAYKAATEYLQGVLKVQDDALSAHVERAKRDTEALTKLNERITSLDEYVETLEDRDSVCLAGPDVDRLRDLWNDPKP